MITLIVWLLILAKPKDFRREFPDSSPREVLFVVALFEVITFLLDVLGFIFLVNLLH